MIECLVATFIPQTTFIHYSMIFQQNLNKRQTLIDHFESLLHDRGYQHMGERAITKSRVANVEGGVFRLDGNIQRSLNKAQRDAIDHGPFPYLKHIPRFKIIESNFAFKGILGPSLGSVSQNWQ